MIKMTIREILEKFAVKLSPNDPEFPQNVHHYIGCFGYNNGTLAIVTPEAECYIIRMATFACSPIDGGAMPLEVSSEWNETYEGGHFVYEVLHAAGYERAGLWVPHSNDSGAWCRAHMPVTQAQLVNELVEAKSLREAVARRDRIIALEQTSL